MDPFFLFETYFDLIWSYFLSDPDFICSIYSWWILSNLLILFIIICNFITLICYFVCFSRNEAFPCVSVVLRHFRCRHLFPVVLAFLIPRPSTHHFRLLQQFLLLLGSPSIRQPHSRQPIISCFSLQTLQLSVPSAPAVPPLALNKV
jgi:hypothetical protein